MVGKGIEPKNSRIFQQCYVNCCKLQNLTPLNYVIPSANSKVLDFCVDRIKYVEWPPILNALSCDLSLHYVSIKCRQQVKTVLEHIDCERLAKTVNKRCVLLTNFMLSNLVEALTQLLSNTTLLTTLMLDGIPLRIPYLNPLCETILLNNCLQHLHLPRCLIGDAGCLAICKALRCLPNILTIDLAGCELTPLGAGYIADVIKYQKIHRYSENWTHTLRYRLPDLDTMAGLRRITVCGNPQLGDTGVVKLLEVLADDLWIKALDVQNCNLTEAAANTAIQMLKFNTTLVVLDLRNNVEVACETLSKIRTALRHHERGMVDQFSWLASSSSSHSTDKLAKPIASKNGVTKERTVSNVRNAPMRNVKNNLAKKEKEYIEVLEEQLQEEISHRHQLEELNSQLVNQMKQLKQQQVKQWLSSTASSDSEHSLGASCMSGDASVSSGSTSSVAIDQTTLSYIQQAFKDIYSFIKNNQCYGQCTIHEPAPRDDKQLEVLEESETPMEETVDNSKNTEYSSELRVNVVPKRAQSTHHTIRDSVKKVKKMTQSAHLLGEMQLRDTVGTKPDMFEKRMGDTRNAHNIQLNNLEEIIAAQTKIGNERNAHNTELNNLEEIIAAQTKIGNEKCSPCSSVSSDTLVCSPQTRRSMHKLTVDINPREAFYSTSESDDEST